MKKKSHISPEVHALASQVKDLEAKARALGMFDNTRELVRCPKFGLEASASVGRIVRMGEGSTPPRQAQWPHRYRQPAIKAV